MPGRRQGPGESSNSLHPQGECGYWGHTHMPAIRIQYSNQYKESVLIQRVVEAEMKHSRESGKMKTGTHSLDLVIRETVNTLVQTEHVHKICITSAYQVQLSLLLKSAPPSTPTQESHARLTIAGQWPETVQA